MVASPPVIVRYCWHFSRSTAQSQTGSSSSRCLKYINNICRQNDITWIFAMALAQCISSLWDEHRMLRTTCILGFLQTNGLSIAHLWLRRWCNAR